MELSTMITVMKNHNICSYFLLPLLGLSVTHFGDNFENSYLSPDKDEIYVKVKDLSLLSYEQQQQFSLVVTAAGTEYLMFRFPDMWKKDLDIFKLGKYSEMSDEAKDMIMNYSGLLNNLSTTGMLDFRLAALRKEPVLAEMIAEQLDVSIDSVNELLEPPGERMYLTIPIVETKPIV